ncbi:MAG: pantoate--beta-alanine ligase [Phycisphaerales bacterium]|nr:pantoate--beta-alanine ligase [Phycisphaerales bacterium]
MHTVRVFRDIKAIAAHVNGAFVPTMGMLHAGHCALIKAAAGSGKPVTVSIFVNPTQFGPNEDFSRYPRQPEQDVELAAQAGADFIFMPDEASIYPPDQAVKSPPLPPAATEPELEDRCRPGHFGGVCTVVARLFDLLLPSEAYFGEKDYQQLLAIRQMVAAAGDRWPDLSIEGCPTVREPDGLALSSRNVYLDSARREQALGLYRALRAAADGEDAMRRVLDEHALHTDYAVIRNANTLLEAAGPQRALIAAKVGTTRLIDNAAMGANP